MDSACLPACAGRECGDDGCSGVCGECDAGQTCTVFGKCETVTCTAESDCSASGLHCNLTAGLCLECVNHSHCPGQTRCEASGNCVPVSLCASTLDCPGDLVCDQTAAICVQCAGDEDCNGLACGADNQCHELHDCDSDKDCKAWSLICDKEGNTCVDCLEDVDCQYNAWCKDHFCLVDECTQGTSQCDGKHVVSCSENGSELAITQTCGGDEYCKSGECFEQVCPPGLVWCDDNTLNECDEIGSELVEQIDCSAGGQYCIEATCVDVVCPPSSVNCISDFIAGVCSADGQYLEAFPCPPETYCLAGDCLDWVCVPNQKSCQGTVAVACNSKGSLQTTTDCALTQQGCKAGQCKDIVCEAGKLFCVDQTTQGVCSGDGLSFEEGPCPEESYCEEGQCFPWECQPLSAMCDGNLLYVCDEFGSQSVLSKDCAEDGLVCLDGSCQCVPACQGKQCGPDGCGGSCGVCEGAQSQCQDGTCICVPNCAGKECGADGCDGDCGQCDQPQHSCVAGKCECQPECGGKQCGPDGCGGQCGVCEGAGVCIAGLCPPPGKDCDDGNSVAWDGCTGFEFSEFRWSTPQAGKQEAPHVAFSDSGVGVAVWQEWGLDKSSFAVAARVYHPGEPFSSEPVMVNSYELSSQSSPQIASLGDNGFVVVWESAFQDGANSGIFGQLLDLTGAKVGDEFAVNFFTSGSQEEPAVAGFADGSFVVVWEGVGEADDSSFGVYGRAFGPGASPKGGDTLLNVYTMASQSSPTLAPVGEDKLAAAWFSIQQDGYSGGIFGRWFSSDFSAMGNETQVNQTSSYNQDNPAMAGRSDGTAVAVWSSYQQDGSMWGIFGQRFSASGEYVGPEFGVNSITTGAQDFPAVSMSSDGSFVVVWETGTADSGKDIMVRSYSPAGVANGVETLANVQTQLDQTQPCVCVIPGTSQYVILWLGLDEQGETEVFGRRLSTDGTAFYL